MFIQKFDRKAQAYQLWGKILLQLFAQRPKKEWSTTNLNRPKQVKNNDSGVAMLLPAFPRGNDLLKPSSRQATDESSRLQPSRQTGPQAP